MEQAGKGICSQYLCAPHFFSQRQEKLLEFLLQGEYGAVTLSNPLPPAQTSTQPSQLLQQPPALARGEITSPGKQVQGQAMCVSAGLQPATRAPQEASPDPRGGQTGLGSCRAQPPWEGRGFLTAPALTGKAWAQAEPCPGTTQSPGSGSSSSRAANKERSPRVETSHLSPSGSSQFWVSFPCASSGEEKRFLHCSMTF